MNRLLWTVALLLSFLAATTAGCKSEIKEVAKSGATIDGSRADPNDLGRDPATGAH